MMQFWIKVIFELGVAIFEIYLMQLLVTSFFKERRVIKFKAVLFVLAVLVNFSINLLANTNLMIISIKTITICFVIAVVLNKSKVLWGVLAALVYYIVGGISELAAAAIVTIPQEINFSTVTTFNMQQVQGVTIAKILDFTLIHLIARFRKVKIEEIPLKTFLPLIALPSFSIVLILQITVSYITSDAPISILAIFSILSLSYMNIIVFTLIERIIKRAESDKLLGIMETQLKTQEDHIVQITQTHLQIRHMKHDFKQYILTLKMICEQKKYDELSKMLDKLLTEQLGLTPLIITENPMIDAILSAKRQLAEQNNISCSWNIAIEPSLPVEELELCAILGNALDNSIEACMNVSEERFINLELFVDDGRNSLLCKITNSVGKNPEPNGKFLKSSKGAPGEHGLGLQSMLRCCESLGGDMSFEYDSKVFELKIILPLLFVQD